MTLLGKPLQSQMPSRGCSVLRAKERPIARTWIHRACPVRAPARRRLEPETVAGFDPGCGLGSAATGNREVRNQRWGLLAGEKRCGWAYQCSCCLASSGARGRQPKERGRAAPYSPALRAVAIVACRLLTGRRARDHVRRASPRGGGTRRSQHVRFGPAMGSAPTRRARHDPPRQSQHRLPLEVGQPSQWRTSLVRPLSMLPVPPGPQGCPSPVPG
eukprot:scaffold122904_cov30-Tisochrysis_lutea.AAC.4